MVIARGWERFGKEVHEDDHSQIQVLTAENQVTILGNVCVLFFPLSTGGSITSNYDFMGNLQDGKPKLSKPWTAKTLDVA